MKKLITRAITGGAYVALIVISLLIDSPILFVLLFAIFLILGINEFQSLTNNNKEHKIIKGLDILGGLIMFLSFYWKSTHPETGIEIIAPYLAYIIIRNIYQLYIKAGNILEEWAYSFMGQFFVALPISLLSIIYNNYNPKILLAVFIFIWLNDTGAFCVGSLIGKNKLFERISPKKSWEGFWGGLFLCVFTSIIFYYFGNSFFNGPELAVWIGLSIIVSIFSTWGDLCESLIKRSLGVKDSGNILPGHGGILDRIDSLLLVSPTVLLYFSIISFLAF